MTGPAGRPSAARSALTLRLLLAMFGFIVCAGAALAFAVLELPAAPIVVFAGLAIIALVDVFVIIWRKRHCAMLP